MDVYSFCPQYKNESYLLRMVKKDDAADLLKVYSDKKAVPLFNCDNCGGEDFYYTTEEQMKQAIDYWLWEYGRKGFVRWSIISKSNMQAIGTIELFHRNADDYFSNCGLLRLDLRSDYEKAEEISKILKLIIEPAYTLFDCSKIATKAIPTAAERIAALKELGFALSNEKLIGHDGTQYASYFVLGMRREKDKIIDSRCGLHCSTCEYKQSCGCGGCIATNGHPFYGECSLARCCQNKGAAYCGACSEFPCELLTEFSYDAEHGDTPKGARIEECKKWRVLSE